jgi:hypothetical protein
VPGYIGWNYTEEGEEEEIVEGVAAWAVGRERCILDCWILEYTYQYKVLIVRIWVALVQKLFSHRNLASLVQGWEQRASR